MTTAGPSLTEFLLARIAEDEGAARNESERREEWWEKYRGASVALTSWDTGPGDPARVLAECEAKRLLITDLTAEKHEVVGDCWYTCAAANEERDGGETCDDNRRGTGCDCGRDYRVNRRLGFLALPYADHPDWREEWRP